MMKSLEDRASDLLDRLDDLSLGDGLTEDDFIEIRPREPLRTCCSKLALHVWALFESSNAIPSKGALRAAVLALQSAASTQGAAASGRLDEALSQLAQTLGATWHGGIPRLDAMELLVAAVQGSAMKLKAMDETDHAASSADATEGQLATAIDTVEQDVGAASVDPAAAALSQCLRSLADVCGGDASVLSATTLAADLEDRVNAFVHRLPQGFFDAILPRGSLTEEQEAMLHDLDRSLRSEYALRRRMLLERAKVTLQSFAWSPRLVDDSETRCKAQHVIDTALSVCTVEPNVHMDDVFSATLGDVMTVTERATSGGGPSGALRGGGDVHARVKFVLIGSVPDRGGRAEGRSRAADMPAWKARKARGAGGAGVAKRGRVGRGRNDKGGRKK